MNNKKEKKPIVLRRLRRSRKEKDYDKATRGGTIRQKKEN